MNTYEIHQSPGSPYYVIERRHDGGTFASTGSPLRTVAGPFLTRDDAANKLAWLEDDAAFAGRA